MSEDPKPLVPQVVPGVPVSAVTGPRRELSMREQRAAVVQRADDRLRNRARRILDAIPLAAKLDDTGLPVDGTQLCANGVPEGWTAVAYNVAKDSRRPLKTQPGYLAAMTRVHESYVKSAAAKPEGPKLNVDVRFYVHQEVKNYATVDVTDEADGNT